MERRITNKTVRNAFVGERKIVCTNTFASFIHRLWAKCMLFCCCCCYDVCQNFARARTPLPIACLPAHTCFYCFTRTFVASSSSVELLPECPASPDPVESLLDVLDSPRRTYTGSAPRTLSSVMRTPLTSDPGTSNIGSSSSVSCNERTVMINMCRKWRQKKQCELPYHNCA